MQVRTRACGLEYELGVLTQDRDGNFGSAVEIPVGQYLIGAHKRFPGVLKPIFNLAYLWHTNGSRSYMERGNHPEHCTPETRTVLEAVCFAKAGEHVCADFFEEPMDNGHRILLFKNNLGWDEVGTNDEGFACHENYMLVSPELFLPEHTLDKLVPFFMTRQIFDGAGWWNTEGIYTFSARMCHLLKQYRVATWTAPAFATLKRESSTGATSTRFHVTCGDSNILEFATYLKMGTMMLLLNLVEADRLPSIYCPSIQSSVNETVRSGTDVNASTMALYVRDMNKKCFSPLQVQTLYLEAVREALKDAEFDSEEIEAESRHVLLLWEQTLNALYRNDEKWMRGRIDWVTKKYIIETMINAMRNPAPDSIRRMRKDIDIGYHNISDPWLQERMRKTWPDRRICTDSDIERAKTIPPQNTRALLRSRFIEAVLAKAPDSCPMVDWASWGWMSLSVPFSAPDPLIYQSKAFDDFLENIDWKSL